jgi:NitT/TauT family transport system permease protein
LQASAAPALSARSGFSLRTRRFFALLVSIAAVIAFWSWVWDKTDFLPSPSSTWSVGVELLGEGGTYGDLFATARRLFMGLSIGYLSAFAVALMMRQSRWWKLFLAPHVFVLISMPGLALALICLMVFGLSEIGVYLAVAGVVFPFVVVSLQEGFDNLDAKLSDMARVYRFSTWVRIRHQAIPEMAPYLFAAFRNVHALAWKIVVIAELFSQQTGIGFQYKRAYGFFEFERLLVWAFLFMAMVLIVEYAVLRPFEAGVFRWRSRGPVN